MKGLRPEDRALFDAGREGLGPSEGDRARIGKALGIAAGVTSVTTAAGAAAGGGGAAAGAGIASGGILAAKWIVVAVVVVGVGAGGVAVRVRDAAPSARARGDVASPASMAPSIRAPAEMPSPVAKAEAPSGPGPRESGSSAVRAVPPTKALSSSVTQAGTATAAPVQAGVSVAEEARLLREADAALRSGDTARAAGLLADHARQFPHGVLVEERDAQRVLVLCAAGQEDDARAEASRFLRAYPESPLAGRVRLACARP
jgi:hypothetical protein